jgi:hypothetical protein
MISELSQAPLSLKSGLLKKSYQLERRIFGALGSLTASGL